MPYAVRPDGSVIADTLAEALELSAELSKRAREGAAVEQLENEPHLRAVRRGPPLRSDITEAFRELGPWFVGLPPRARQIAELRAQSYDPSAIAVGLHIGAKSVSKTLQRLVVRLEELRTAGAPVAWSGGGVGDSDPLAVAPTASPPIQLGPIVSSDVVVLASGGRLSSSSPFVKQNGICKAEPAAPARTASPSLLADLRALDPWMHALSERSARAVRRRLAGETEAAIAPELGILPDSVMGVLYAARVRMEAARDEDRASPPPPALEPPPIEMPATGASGVCNLRCHDPDCGELARVHGCHDQACRAPAAASDETAKHEQPAAVRAEDPDGATSAPGASSVGARRIDATTGETDPAPGSGDLLDGQERGGAGASCCAPSAAPAASTATSGKDLCTESSNAPGRRPNGAGSVVAARHGFRWQVRERGETIAGPVVATEGEAEAGLVQALAEHRPAGAGRTCSACGSGDHDRRDCPSRPGKSRLSDRLVEELEALREWFPRLGPQAQRAVELRLAGSTGAEIAAAPGVAIHVAHVTVTKAKYRMQRIRDGLLVVNGQRRQPGSGSIMRNGPSWRWQVQRDGKPISGSNVPTREEAEASLEAFLAANPLPVTPRACTICHQVGHNARTCGARAVASATEPTLASPARATEPTLAPAAPAPQAPLVTPPPTLASLRPWAPILSRRQRDVYELVAGGMGARAAGAKLGIGVASASSLLEQARQRLTEAARLGPPPAPVPAVPTTDSEQAPPPAAPPTPRTGFSPLRFGRATTSSASAAPPPPSTPRIATRSPRIVSSAVAPPRPQRDLAPTEPPGPLDPGDFESFGTDADYGDAPRRIPGQRLCSKCDGAGHNAKTCPAVRLDAIAASVWRLRNRATAAPVKHEWSVCEIGQVARSVGWDRSDPEQDLTGEDLGEPPAPAAPPPANDVSPEPAPEPGAPPPADADEPEEYEGAVAFARRRSHPNTTGRIQARTLAAARLTRDERRLSELVVYPDDAARPLTRGDCAAMPRPCPFVSCAHHLYLDVSEETGAIKFNFPHLEPDQLPVSCSLDVADNGGATLEEVGAMMNVTRERIRQLEMSGMAQIRLAHKRKRIDFEDAADHGYSPLGEAIVG